MITERRPLGNLDLNSTRVQPTRAAKTGHKWLSNRTIKSGEENNAITTLNDQSIDCSRVQQHLLLQSQDRNSTTAVGIFEQNCNATLGSEAEQSKCFFDNRRLGPNNCDNYKHLVCTTKNPRLPVPLQTLALNSINNASVHCNLSTENNKPSYFSPLHQTNKNSSSVNAHAESHQSFMSDDLSDNFLSRSDCLQKVRKHHRSADSDAYLNKVKKKHPDLEILDEYMVEVLSYMKSSEQKYKPRVNYLKKQSEITPPMRVKLIDWLVEVQDEYKLHDETLYLAVAYVDRFLSEMSVTRAKLQLLGTTSMFVAAKFEEIYPPDADEFAYVTADTYTRTEVLLMERMILKVFNCTLAIPTAFQYLTYFHEKSNLDDKMRYLSFYLSELTLLDDKYLAYAPSVKAAAAVSLALCTVRHAHDSDVANGNLNLQDSENMNLEVENRDDLNFPRVVISSSIQDVMCQDVEMIFQCVLDMAKSHVQESNLSHFVREKYSSPSHRNVASITPATSYLSSDQPNPLSWSSVTSLWLT